MKTPWAVACAVLAFSFLASGFAGCSTVPKKPGEAGPAKNPAAESAPAGTSADGGGAAKAAGQAPESPPGSPSPQYRLGPEDVLRISVWENRELTQDVTVRPDGKISLPLVQDVQAEKLTAAELSEVLRKKLLPFIKDPQVSVIVTQVNAPKIYVLGNVARPGTFPLRGDMSILQALSLAGGFTQFASPRSIRLVRNENGKQEVRKVNYYNMLDEEGTGNYLLKPGDTIVVP